MSRFKQWTATLVSRIDGIVAQAENHEAVAESSIREIKRAIARGKVQLARVRRDGLEIRRRHEEEQTAATRWRDRARSTASEDQDKALECLRRSKRATGKAQELAARSEEHERVEKQLIRDMAASEERLAALRERRNVMRTRQSRAEALSTARGSCGAEIYEVEGVFDRWETRITELELDSDSSSEIDGLDSEYSEIEEKELLLAELAELTESAATTAIEAQS